MFFYRLMIFIVFNIISFGCIAEANYFNLGIRYESGFKKTFIAGPYEDKISCEKGIESTLTGVKSTCGSCKIENKSCSESSKLSKIENAVLSKQPAPFPYLIATDRDRIIFSGMSRVLLERECDDTKNKFKAKIYKEAKCIY